MLQMRHLAPIYGDRTPLAPLPRDGLVIDPAPDILVTGHAHTYGVDRYRGVLLLNASTWQSETEYQRMRNISPVPARAAVVDLATLALATLDFSAGRPVVGETARMSPYPLDPARAVGPMRLVLTTYPSRRARPGKRSRRSSGRRSRHARTSCPGIPATGGRAGSSRRTNRSSCSRPSPKRVGALFRHLETHHPYDVPEIAEVDVPRVGKRLPSVPGRDPRPRILPPPTGGGPTRRGARRAPGARSPGRTRAPHRRRSR